MKKMNAKNVPPIADTFALDANGKALFMNVSLRNIQMIDILLFDSVVMTKLWPILVLYLIACEHEENCAHPKKTGAEVMLALEATDASITEDKKLFNTLIELLSYEKIIFNGSILILFISLLFFNNNILYTTF